jgi:hypothetical protein
MIAGPRAPAPCEARGVRLLALWVALCAAAAGCGTAARISLLPPVELSSRDPNPTRPLVETQVAPPRNEDDGRPRRYQGMIGPVDAGVSSAAVLAWLLGGAAPLLGIYGTFEETSWFQPRPGQDEGSPQQ